jgi:hypothetical protein
MSIEIAHYEMQLAEMIKRLNELNMKEKIENEKKEKNIKLFVEISKEEINRQKTPKQINVENNSSLFMRNKVPYDRLFHPYRTGNKMKVKRYTDMFNYKLISHEGKNEGKVKFINKFLSIDEFVNNVSEPREISVNVKEIKKDKNENDIKKDKVYIALQKKKINDLKIVARDLKLKGYSTMYKEELVKKIFEIVKQKEAEKKEKELKEKDNKINENKKMTKVELLKSCEIEEPLEEYENNDETSDNDDDEYNDGSINESEELDYN